MVAQPPLWAQPSRESRLLAWDSRAVEGAKSLSSPAENWVALGLGNESRQAHLGVPGCR